MSYRICAIFLCVSLGLGLTPPAAKARPLSIVQHLTRVKIIESNNVTTRPGSVYDIVTRFESIFSLPRPGFNYLFVDTGLGTAEPLYPLKQIGHQGSWFQLIPAFFSKRFRHIDHFTSMETPEGCRVDSLYLLRHINEFPGQYEQERLEGYENIVIRMEYYTRLRPDARCGRHRDFSYDPNFDLEQTLKLIRKARNLSDIPKDILDRFDARVSAIRHLDRQFGWNKWPRFDRQDLGDNSLWYYPDGFQKDYGLNKALPQPVANDLKYPAQFLIPIPKDLRSELALDRVLKPDEWQSLLNILNGKPTVHFDPKTEPGNDTFSLSQVSNQNIYTSGLYREAIEDVTADITNPQNYRPVSLIVRPYEPEEDFHFEGQKTLPQVRLVYQLMDPRQPNRAFEQLFFHVNFDGMDRLTDGVTFNQHYRDFLKRYAQLANAPQNNSPASSQALRKFLTPYLQTGVEELSFSSSLTGIWAFGALSRSHNIERTLEPVRIVREGVDVGFYSTLYDNDLFYQAIENARTFKRKRLLKRHMKDLRVETYRDPKRHDVHQIKFSRMTCAQCHQLAGRDAVHISVNDHLDRRIQGPIRSTEYVYRELQRQLEAGQSYWSKQKP